MRHKHYEMIVAKAENMDLVVFFNPSFWSGSDKWEEATTTLFPAFHPDTEYFLCLPQHKDACLHWLNGGDIEFTYTGVHSWMRSNRNGKEISWSPFSDFMRDEFDYRIKAHKEKRWIGVNVTTGKTTSAYTHDDEGNYAEDEVRLTNGNLSDWQFIEIEVEV